MNAKEYFKKGNNLLFANKFIESIKMYNQAINLKSDYSSAFSNRGYAKDSLGKYGAAIKDYSKAIELKPDFVEALLNRGSSKFSLELNEAAILDFNDAIKLNDKLPDAFFNRGAAREKLYQHKAAIEDFNKAIELKHDFLEAYFNRGKAYRILHMYKNAIEDFSKTIVLNPSFAEAYSHRGFTKLLLHQYEFAKEDFSEAIKLNPNLENAYHLRAFSNFRLQQFNSAIKDLSKLILKKSKVAQVYDLSSVCKIYLKQYKSAILDCNKSIELNSYNIEAFSNRGIAKSKIQQYESAINDLSKVIELSPNYALGFSNRGQTFMEKGDIIEARKNFLRAIFLGIEMNQNFKNYFLKYPNAPFLMLNLIHNPNDLIQEKNKLNSPENFIDSGFKNGKLKFTASIGQLTPLKLFELNQISYNKSKHIYSFILHQILNRNNNIKKSNWLKWLGKINYFMGDQITSYKIFKQLRNKETTDLMVYYYLILSCQSFLEWFDDFLDIAIPISEKFRDLESQNFNDTDIKQIYYAGHIFIMDEEKEEALKCFKKISDFSLPAMYMCAHLNFVLNKEQETIESVNNIIQREIELKNKKGFLGGLELCNLNLDKATLDEPFQHCISYFEIHNAIETVINEIQKINSKLNITIKFPNQQKYFWEYFEVSPLDLEMSRLRLKLSPFIKKWEKTLEEYNKNVSSGTIKSLKKQLKGEIETKSAFEFIKKSMDKEAEIGLYIESNTLGVENLIKVINYFFARGELTAYEKLVLHFYALDQKYTRQQTSKASLAGLKDGVKKVVSEGLSVLTGIFLGELIPGLLPIEKIITISFLTFGTAYAKGALGELFLDFHRNSTNHQRKTYLDFRKKFEFYISGKMEALGEIKFYRRYPINVLEN